MRKYFIELPCNIGENAMSYVFSFNCTIVHFQYIFVLENTCSLLQKKGILTSNVVVSK